MNDEFIGKLNLYLKNQELDAAIKFAELELGRHSTTPFHKILNRNLLHLSGDLKNYLSECYSSAETYFLGNKKSLLIFISKKIFGQKPLIETIHCEMNDFDFNTDNWFISFYAHTQKGSIDNTDWLDEFEYSSDNRLNITGLEDLQAVYDDFTIHRKWGDPHFDMCSEICDYLIVLRLQELFKKTFESEKMNNLSWTKNPIYVTDHYHEIIYRTIA
jgi:hypothetical protein